MKTTKPKTPNEVRKDVIMEDYRRAYRFLHAHNSNPSNMTHIRHVVVGWIADGTHCYKRHAICWTDERFDEVVADMNRKGASIIMAVHA